MTEREKIRISTMIRNHQVHTIRRSFSSCFGVALSRCRCAGPGKLLGAVLRALARAKVFSEIPKNCPDRMDICNGDTSRPPASRVTEVSRGVRTYNKDKGKPIGTVADCLVGTAIDCVISWKSLSLTVLAFDIFV